MIQVHITKHELVTIPGEKVDQHDVLASPRATERYVLTRLRNAGIPVHGITFLVALEKGTLTMEKEWDGSYRYTWRDNG